MAENPKVFISYSHDSPEHKRWVSELAAKLRHKGINAILDQWDLGLGDDVTRFMERGIVNADRVLVICTDKYVSKANANEGGVGYERMIVNAELVKNLGTDKFIPIIRQASGKEKTPTFLGTRVYADFTNDRQFDVECGKLIRELHEIPVVQKPPLGKNPFPSVGLDTQLVDIPEHVESASEAYKIATKLARTGDVLGWRELIKEIRPRVFKNLVQWREDELDGKEPKGKEQLDQVVDKAVEIVSPLMVIALAGVESGREEFRQQKSFLNDLLNIAEWNHARDTVSVHISEALRYVYHSLHGGLSLSTNQIDLALGLASVKIYDIYSKGRRHLWKLSELMGWIDSLGGGCVEGWKYLVEAFKRWDWLSCIFEEELEYQSSLVAYYMLLNIYELAILIASNRQDRLINSNYTSNVDFDVPLTFMTENQDIYKRAKTLLLRDPDSVAELWRKLNVTHEQMQNLWRKWVDLFKTWLGRVYSSSSVNVNRQIYSSNIIDHKDFLDML